MITLNQQFSVSFVIVFYKWYMDFCIMYILAFNQPYTPLTQIFLHWWHSVPSKVTTANQEQ